MKMQLMRFAGCVLVAISVGSAFGVTACNWQWPETGGFSPDDPLDWFDEGNWENGLVAKDATSTATFPTTDVKRYIRVDRDLVVGQIKSPYQSCSDSEKIVIISDHLIDLSTPAGAMNLRGVTLYATLKISRSAYTQAAVLCGDFAPDSWLHMDASVLQYHHRYANAAGEVRDGCAPSLGCSWSGSTYAPYGPQSSPTNVVGKWKAVKGSPFLKRVGAKHVLSAGTIVSNEGNAVIPEGAFLKRIFDDDTIEISAVALDDAVEGVDVTFAAFSPKVSLYTQKWHRNNYLVCSARANMFAPTDELRYTVGELVYSKGNPYIIDTDTGWYPGTIVIEDATAILADMPITLKRCHLEFAGAPGKAAGFPSACVSMNDGSNIAQLTVTNGVEASILSLNNVIGRIVKDGAGSLTLGLTNEVARNTGKLTVQEGTVELPAGSWVKTVEVSAGATLRIHGEFQPEVLTVEPGAKLDGDGTLVVTDANVVKSFVCSKTVSIRVLGGTEKPVVDPEFKVVGNPAFWVDATNRATMTFRNDDGVNVTRINDVRKQSDDDGYMFATNVVHCPTMMQIGGVDCGIYFDRLDSTTFDITKVQELVWSVPITNIYAIFQVVDVRGGGGQFLGMTERLYSLVNRPNDFQRDVNAIWNNDIFYRGNGTTQQKAVLNGELRINGDRIEGLASGRGYLYPGGDYLNINTVTGNFAPQVCEVVPTMPVAADTFSFDYGAGLIVGRNGRKLFCELIVYTNALTYAERVQISGYLTRKWVGCEVSYAETGADALDNVDVAKAPALAVGEGETLVVDTCVGTGTVVKKGDGDLFVGGLSSTVSLDVEGGTLELRTAAVAPMTIAELPAGALWHMDANDTTKYTYNTETKAMTSGWTSSVGNGVWSALNKYSYVTNHPSCGKTMIDMGEPRFASSNSTGRAFSMTKSTKIRSMFMVQDATQGGTTLFGNSASYSYEGAMRGNWAKRWFEHKDVPCFLVSDPLIAPEFTFGISDIWKNSRIRLNGERVDPTTTGFTGNGVIDIVSAVGYNRMSADRFGYNNGHGQFLGGGLIGEYILYERCLDQKEVLKVEAYLAQKWGKPLPAGFAPVEVGDIRLANGATLKLTGETALTAASLGGAGTVRGSVEFGNAFVAVVREDGTIGTVTVTGDVASAGGTVTLDGAVQALVPGTYRLLRAASANIGEWTFVAPTSGRASRLVYTLTADDEGLVLKVDRRGSLVIVR